MLRQLTDQELMLAKWKAEQFGNSEPSVEATDDAPPEVEEIQVLSCYGTDTGVLDADIRRAVENMDKK